MHGVKKEGEIGFIGHSLIGNSVGAGAGAETAMGGIKSAPVKKVTAKTVNMNNKISEGIKMDKMSALDNYLWAIEKKAAGMPAFLGMKEFGAPIAGAAIGGATGAATAGDDNRLSAALIGAGVGAGAGFGVKHLHNSALGEQAAKASKKLDAVRAAGNKTIEELKGGHAKETENLNATIDKLKGDVSTANNNLENMTAMHDDATSQLNSKSRELEELIEKNRTNASSVPVSRKQMDKKIQKNIIPDDKVDENRANFFGAKIRPKNAPIVVTNPNMFGDTERVMF